MGCELSHISYRDVAQFVLAGVPLGKFWPSCSKGSLVYAVVRWPRGPSTLTTRQVVALFHGPAQVTIWQIYTNLDIDLP